ncbi:MAG: MFS transporter [Inquilinaceae bacterium]
MSAVTSLRAIVPLFRLPTYGQYLATKTGMAVVSQMAILATGWIAWDLTGAALWLGIIAFLRLGPSLVLGLIGGAVADRTPPLRIVQILVFLQIPVKVALFGLVLSDHVTIALLSALTLVTGCLQALANPADKALVWHLVPKDLLPAAIPTNSTLANIAAFAGPLIGGVVIALAGPAWTYLAAALASAVFVLALSRVQVVRPAAVARRPASLTQDMVAGLRYACGDRTIAAVLLIHVAVSFCARPLQHLLPGFAASVFGGGAQLLGLLSASLAAGAVVGGVWLAARSRLDGLVDVLMIAMVALMGLLMLFAALPNVLMAPVLLFAIGTCLIVRAAGVQTLLQMSTAPEMRGRVMGLYGVSMRVGTATGALAFGALADLIGLRASVAVAALLGLVVLVLRWRATRNVSVALKT